MVLVDDGRVAASGTHDELLETSERYREVLAALTEEEREAAETADAGGAGDQVASDQVASDQVGS